MNKFLIELGVALGVCAAVFWLGFMIGRNGMKPKINQLEQTISDMRQATKTAQEIDAVIVSTTKTISEKINENIKESFADGSDAINADYERLRRESTALKNSSGKETLPGVPNISGGTDAATCEMGLLERRQATLNSLQLIKLQQAIVEQSVLSPQNP